MQKSNKVIISCGMALYFLCGGLTMAVELDENMQVLARNMSVLQSSMDKKELLEALDRMNDAVNESMKSLPESISSADEEGRNDYIKELQKLEKEIMQAKQKVSSGQLSDIRDSVSKMNKIRVEGHDKFR
ncbi:TPA: cytochrome b562 family protein [Escherichia coli]|nr:cytochrome b562 [Escherichia coli]HBA7004260.1 cytochrome b562 family protein [Escherichia coli]HBA8202212.1 cytochrome b562 family protein [Escherichia coli]HBA8669978.1 cytochrome b562 family protein [Escherichia coli]HBA8710258.1 cytochrome b562 family protein [Escherichia coli]